MFVLAKGLGLPGVAVAPALAPVLPPWAASAREKPPGGGGDGAQGSCPHAPGRRVGSPSFEVHGTGRDGRILGPHETRAGGHAAAGAGHGLPGFYSQTWEDTASVGDRIVSPKTRVLCFPPGGRTSKCPRQTQHRKDAVWGPPTCKASPLHSGV